MRRKSSLFLCFCMLLSAFLVSCGNSKYQKIKKETEPVVLPVMHIQAEKQRTDVTREEYVPMQVSIQGCQDAKYNIRNVTGKIRGRGNSTWDFCEKKSYKLKLDLKINLLGMGKGGEKDWALISNAREKSMLRNYSMFRLGEKMGMPVTAARFIQVFFNSEYIGLYLLTETVEVAKNRLNIRDEGPDPDIGYLLELDRRAQWESKSPYDYFYIDGWKIPFSIKSHVENEAQNAFIQRHLQMTDAAIAGGKKEEIEKFLDLKSTVDLYIIEELSKDRDVGFASLFLYKDIGGKLFFAYPWDFDLALGNDSGEDRLHEKDSLKIDYKGTKDIMAGALHPWFSRLLKEKWFKEAVKERLLELSDTMETLLEEVIEMGYSLEKEAEKNYERWQIMGKKQLFEPYKVYQMTKYTDHVDYLVSWMEERISFLTKYFKEESA